MSCHHPTLLVEINKQNIALRCECGLCGVPLDSEAWDIEKEMEKKYDRN